MPSIDGLFINVQTSGVADVPMVVSSSWGAAGEPTINVQSSGALPEGVTLRTIVYPSGAISTAFMEYLILPANTDELSKYTSSGVYSHSSYFANSGTYKFIYDIIPSYENTIYNVSYYANYFDIDNNAIYGPVIEELSEVYLTPTSRPKAGNLSVTSALSSTDSSWSTLNVNVIQNREITNRGLSSPGPYLLSVSGIDGWYTPQGTVATGYDDTNNYFDYSLSGMLLSLPYISGTQASASVYEVQLRWLDSNGRETDPLIFNTATLKTSIDDFEAGDLEAFSNISVKRVTEIPIKSDVLKRKRFAVGIEDLALVNETFKKQGLWISDYYTIDDPIYTFFLRVGETMPAIVSVPAYNMVTYHVQFQNQDWIRISPVSRGDELDEDGVIVSKFFVLDRLNLGDISADLKELPYDFPVFSFRVRIEIDMSFLTTKSFISPSIDYYECHVTDRNSFLRIE